MLGPANAQFQTMTFNGRTYAAGAGQPLDVPDFDARTLNANGWVFVAASGPTSARPTGELGPYSATEGVSFFDTTLGYVVVFAGVSWRNPSTGAAV
jgi:hypothetical protein